MPNPPAIRLIAIGDELLSGRRQDRHFAKLIELLQARGLQLHSAEFISDDLHDIVACLRRSFATPDIVFCCGGIGATPDDRTRQAAAEALGVPLRLHPEAERLITQRGLRLAREGRGNPDMNAPENRQRLQMGVFPEGAEIIPNEFNEIPGFFIHDHSFMPGFPEMAHPMMRWTLDTRYARWHHWRAHAERSFLAYGVPESRITPALEDVERRWPGIHTFSLPRVGHNGQAPYIELGVKGDPQAVTQAFEWLDARVRAVGAQVRPAAPEALANGGDIS